MVLLAINVFLYQRHLSDQYEQRQRIASLQESITTEQEAIELRQEDLAALGIAQQNDEIAFLNGQIARRTFSWGRLFDRLEEVLPNNVELQRVSPKILKEDRRGRRRDDRLKDLVAIDIRGRAPTIDELLELVDNLFAHGSFTLPNLLGENQRDDGSLEFNLTVLYLPTVKPPTIPATASPELVDTAMPDQTAGGDG